ncbi:MULTISPECIES: hypothetical protein [unclassified Bacillus (in: firmicutes)]|uniref:hypothetical protein n=1 Tax=unclassified Bacillus (in: firmicutes) TaxID=185979 RepID=UPI00178C3FA0|nr:MULTISPECIES: hypothetical protein [unclassified Bacillus (in: firmicutes)]
MKEIHNIFKRECGAAAKRERNLLCLLFRQNTLVERKVLKRERIFITHSAIIEMEQEKFMNDLTHIGRWKK